MKKIKRWNAREGKLKRVRGAKGKNLPSHLVYYKHRKIVNYGATFAVIYKVYGCNKIFMEKIIMSVSLLAFLSRYIGIRVDLGSERLWVKRQQTPTEKKRASDEMSLSSYAANLKQAIMRREQCVQGLIGTLGERRITWQASVFSGPNIYFALLATNGTHCMNHLAGAGSRRVTRPRFTISSFLLG